MKKHLLSSAKILILALVIGLGVSYISAQTPPPCSSPASCNVPAPLNVGSLAQNKNGALGVGGFVNFGQSFLAGDVGVLNSKLRIGSISAQSSPNDQYLELGYDSVHSTINSHAGAGSPGLLINYSNGEDVVVGGGSNPSSAFIANGDARFEGDVKVSRQNGAGAAYACFDADGNLFRSDTDCVAAAPLPHGAFVDTTSVIPGSPGGISETWNVPASLTAPTPITVEIWGAGGGGGGGSTAPTVNGRVGSGGGGGGYMKFVTTATPGSAFSYTIGRGGDGGNTGSPGTAGTNGTATSFFNQIALGGGAGQAITNGGFGGSYSATNGIAPIASANGQVGDAGHICNPSIPPETTGYNCNQPGGGDPGSPSGGLPSGRGGYGGSPSPTNGGPGAHGNDGKIKITW